MLTKRFWNYGFCIHSGLVVIIAASAYAGVLPTACRGIPYCDLVGHAVLIGFLAFFLDGVMKFRPLLSAKLAFIRAAPVIVLSLAAIEEIAQSLSPRRSASLTDFLADVVGVAACSWFAEYLARNRPPMKNKLTRRSDYEIDD